MSNLSAFNKTHLASLLEAFAPGMADHITPIKYEALTPDSFLLLFRTTDRAGDNHYFVSLETDFQKSLEGARCTIEDWYGNEVIAFWPLQAKRGAKLSAEEEVQDYQAPTAGPHFAMLAEVVRPSNQGYWSESVTIMPGDNIGEKINGFSDVAQQNIRKALAQVLKHKVDPAASFLDSLNDKRKDVIVDGINKTDMAVTLYVKPDDSVELFYNYVNQMVGNRPLKQNKQ